MPGARERKAALPEAAALPDPHAMLALQRSAGNAAVGRMLARRFYAVADDGSYVWHPEALDEGQWEDTGKTTRGWLWTYPVYRPRRRADATGATEDAAKPRRRRRRPKKKQATTAETTAAAEPAEDEDVDAVEDETEVAGPGEMPPAVIQPDQDGGGWEEVRSAGAVKAEREMNRDVDGLAGVIDAHEGEPGAISETFSQFFNARMRQGRETTGTIVSSYTTRFDRGRSGYSIEVEIPDLPAWVIHAHLDSDGALAPGENAVHYKRLTDRFSLGVSITLTPRQIGVLLPDQATRRAWQTANRRANV